MAGGHRPLALHLLLERPVVAEAGQRVAQRLGAGAVVGVLEDPPGLLQPLGRFEHASGQPHGEGPEEPRQRDQDDGRDDERRTRTPQPSP